MFKLKLTALGHPNPDSFNSEDEKEFRSVVLWLEDQKIRHYKIEDREDLRNIDNDGWKEAFNMYQKDLVSPVAEGTHNEQLNWLLSYAVRLEYADNVEKYKNVKIAEPKKVAPNVVSSNPLDNLDFSTTAFKASVDRISALCGVGPHNDPKVRLAAIATILKTGPHIDPPKTDNMTVVKQPTDVLKLLFIQDLRNLQTNINEALVAVQNVTADPRTDTKLATRGNCMEENQEEKDNRMAKELEKLPQLSELELTAENETVLLSTEADKSMYLETPKNEAVTGLFTEPVLVPNSSHVAAPQGSTKARVRKAKRLSGAARTRFRILEAKGISREEAFKLAKLPMRDLPPEIRSSVLKRPRIEDKSPQLQVKKVTKSTSFPYQADGDLVGSSARTIEPNEEDVAQRSYSEATSTLQIGIRNSVPMTLEQLSLLRHTLVFEVAKASKQGELLQFKGVSNRAGWLLLFCMSKRCADWVKKEISRIKPWKEASLSVMEEKDLPRPLLVSAFIPQADFISVEHFLSSVRAQNEGLETEIWRTLSSKSLEGGQLLTFAIEEETVESLRRYDFRPFMGLTRVRMWLRTTLNTQRTSLMEKVQAKSHLQPGASDAVRPKVQLAPKAH